MMVMPAEHGRAGAHEPDGLSQNNGAEAMRVERQISGEQCAENGETQDATVDAQCPRQFPALPCRDGPEQQSKR